MAARSGKLKEAAPPPSRPPPFPNGGPMSKPDTPLQSLIDSGTKLWLDSIDPAELARNRAAGATGATSNPIIVADIIKTGKYDHEITRLLEAGHDDETIAWQLTDRLVRQAQE